MWYFWYHESAGVAMECGVFVHSGMWTKGKDDVDSWGMDETEARECLIYPLEVLGKGESFPQRRRVFHRKRGVIHRFG